ncbi:uncharacterized protein TRUGW13939_10279 [Talaromyces rugulosus]|uniref:Carboxylic ester hydrolase n=1 Tax=Talaromyces rugulosus TaxID=121627 RepID=A0A7H8RBE3_TALRU|nr:uncharacterized protein TRUGW13939_10279 [Talaromyces rugulosus]QKX63111.1 hypothetical protein TRUGW13939_10279 [Talaromyces rugulosus]
MAGSIQSLDTLEPRVAQELMYLGSNPAWTCVADSRFCYFLYVPKRYYELKGKLQLAVLIHGSGRNPYTLRREFSDFAETHSCALLAPLFPVGLIDPQDTVNYKFIKYRDIRFDKVLLSMVDEAHARFGKIDPSKFLLYGYSGGGQFVHRFSYLHPRHVQALACGAPGTQTLLDCTMPWPDGVQDFEEVFGQPLDLESLQKIPTIFIAGDADTDIFYAIARGRINNHGDLSKFENGRYGATERLEQNWKSKGANCLMQSVHGAKHEEKPMLQHVKRFFEEQLESQTAISPD